MQCADNVNLLGESQKVLRRMLSCYSDVHKRRMVRVNVSKGESLYLKEMGNLNLCLNREDIKVMEKFCF